MTVIHSKTTICGRKQMKICKIAMEINAKRFEQWCSGYTAGICKQIRKLAEQNDISPDGIDIAVLTGSGCELYPIEIAIRELMNPAAPAKACVLRPSDPGSILNKAIIDDDHPHYLHGPCPKGEIASLACVLGNLAENVELKIPSIDPSNTFDNSVQERTDQHGRKETEHVSTECTAKSKGSFMKLFLNFLNSLSWPECDYEREY